MNIHRLLNKIIDKKNLTKEESMILMEEMLKGELPLSQIAAILTALTMKGETVEEILGFITIMRKNMVKVKTKGTVIDTCGTGGDGKGTFNISTAAALVAAGAGIMVAKHGNRKASSLCGSADVLEELGIKINLTRKQAEEMLIRTKFVFLFVPLFHPLIKHIGMVRRELKIRTVFNLLGPFISPAGVKRQIIGVPNLKIANILSQVALNLNYEKLFILHSRDGLDEISVYAPTDVIEVVGKKLRKFTITPQEYGIEYFKSDFSLKGGDAKANAEIIRDILKGKLGPERDAVLLNSAAALTVSGLTEKIGEGIEWAIESIDKGYAKEVLGKVINYAK